MEVAWIITGVGVPAVLGLGGTLMGASSTIAHWVACMAFLISAVWLGVMGAMWWSRRKERDWTVWLRGGAIAAYVAILIPFLVWLAWPTAIAQTQAPSINGNCNNIGNNNFNCDTLNLGAPHRHLSDAQLSALSSAMKDSGATGKVEVLNGIIGCTDCDSFASQFAAILSAAPGLSVTHKRSYILGLPFKGVALGVPDPAKAPKVASAILKAFRSVGANLAIVKWKPDEGAAATFLVAVPVN